jgi:hypothetical protein
VNNRKNDRNDASLQGDLLGDVPKVPDGSPSSHQGGCHISLPHP